MSTATSLINLGKEYDVLKYLDSHMVLQVLDFYLSKDSDQKENLLRFKKQTLLSTLLFDQQEKFLQDNPALVDGTEAEAISKRKEQTAKAEEETKNRINGFLSLMENFRKNNNFDVSSSMHKKIIDETSVNSLLEYSNILYETGRYAESKEILLNFYKVSHENKKSLSKVILALWKISSINIITGNWDAVSDSFQQIKSVIEALKTNLDEEFKKVNTDSMERLQVDFRHVLLHRGYLIHWSLFMLKNFKGGLEAFLSLVFRNEFYTLIETSFNYMFKYLIIFSLISKSKRNIQTLKHTFASLTYNDAFIDLFNSMFNDYDIEKSHQLLLQCANLMKKEFFLGEFVDLFVAKSKELLLESYISLNSSIDLNTFSKIFGENVEVIRRSLDEVIKVNYDQSQVSEKDGVLVFKPSASADVNKEHLLKTNELFEVTRNMIEMVKLCKQNKI